MTWAAHTTRTAKSVGCSCGLRPVSTVIKQIQNKRRSVTLWQDCTVTLDSSPLRNARQRSSANLTGEGVKLHWHWAPFKGRAGRSLKYRNTSQLTLHNHTCCLRTRDMCDQFYWKKKKRLCNTAAPWGRGERMNNGCLNRNDAYCLVRWSNTAEGNNDGPDELILELGKVRTNVRPP